MKNNVSDWRSVRLDTVAKVIRGITYSKTHVVQAPTNDDIPILRAGNIDGRLIVDNDLVWLPKECVNQEQLLRCNDIVMCMSSGSASVVGKSALLNQDWIGSFGAFCAAIRTDFTKADPGFLAHIFRGPKFRTWASAAQGNNIKNLNKSALEGYILSLPPLDEQRRIVSLLDRAAHIRRRADAARAKARTIIPALFLNMFGDPVTNPKGWAIMRIGNLRNIELRNGISPSKPDKRLHAFCAVTIDLLLRCVQIIRRTIAYCCGKHVARAANKRIGSQACRVGNEYLAGIESIVGNGGIHALPAFTGSIITDIDEYLALIAFKHIEQCAIG